MQTLPDLTTTAEFVEEHQIRLLGHELLQRALRGNPRNPSPAEIAEKTGIHKGMPTRITTYISQNA